MQKIIKNIAIEYHNILGVFYDRLGNHVLSTTHFLSSAKLGSCKAINEIGCRYLVGCGVEKNYKEAYRYFENAAMKEYAYSAANIGWMYKEGLGVSINADKAIYWYGKAAEQGHPESIAILDELKRSNTRGQKNEQK